MSVVSIARAADQGLLMEGIAERSQHLSGCLDRAAPGKRPLPCKIQCSLGNSREKVAGVWTGLDCTWKATPPLPKSYKSEISQEVEFNLRSNKSSLLKTLLFSSSSSSSQLLHRCFIVGNVFKIPCLLVHYNASITHLCYSVLEQVIHMIHSQISHQLLSTLGLLSCQTSNAKDLLF
jgi:hypothetical protein